MAFTPFIVFERSEKSSPLTWHMEDDPVTGGRLPVTVCDHGHEGTLRTHKVRDDGSVSPSLVCHVEACGHHVFGRLDGWVP